MSYPFRTLGWIAALLLTLLAVATASPSNVPTAPVTAEAAAGKRTLQNKSGAMMRRACKATNLHVKGGGRPVSHTVWRSQCHSYQKPRRVRCWKIEDLGDLSRWACTPNFSWTIQENPSRGDAPHDRRPPCYDRNHNGPGQGMGVHYRLTFLVGERAQLEERTVERCNYFSAGVAASIGFRR